MTDAPDANQSASTPAQLLEGPIFPPLARLAIPNTASNFLMIMPLLVEVWRIAELGATALAGLALVFPLFALLVMWSAGSVGGAVSGAVARAVGAGNISQAEAITRSALVIGLLGGLVMLVMVFTGGRLLFSILGGKGQVIEIAWTYTSILFAFNIIIWLFNILIGIMCGAGDRVRPLVAVAMIALLHIAGSGPFILGVGDLGGWGIAGAAVLLVACYGAGLILALFFMLRPTALVWLRPGRIDWALTGRLLRPGLWAASQSLTTIITSLILTGFAARFGPDVLAGYGIGARSSCCQYR